MMPSETHCAISLIDSLGRPTDLETISSALSRMLAEFGFDHFVFQDIPNAGQFAESVFCRRIPDEWFDLYIKENYSLVDPALKLASSSSAPFKWSEAPCDREQEPRAAEFLERVHDFGLEQGLVVPVRTRAGQAGLVWFGGSAPDFDEGVIPMLQLVAFCTFDRLRDLNSPPREHKPLLTQREREVLTWAAAGKTASEIGKILDITKRTVDYHLQSICRKYGAANRTHAVALGIRDGAIELEALGS